MGSSIDKYDSFLHLLTCQQFDVYDIEIQSMIYRERFELLSLSCA